MYDVAVRVVAGDEALNATNPTITISIVNGAHYDAYVLSGLGQFASLALALLLGIIFLIRMWLRRSSE